MSPPPPRLLASCQVTRIGVVPSDAYWRRAPSVFTRPERCILKPVTVRQNRQYFKTQMKVRNQLLCPSGHQFPLDIAISYILEQECSLLGHALTLRAKKISHVLPSYILLLESSQYVHLMRIGVMMEIVVVTFANMILCWFEVR
jgi:hypothetical protein